MANKKKNPTPKKSYRKRLRAKRRKQRRPDFPDTTGWGPDEFAGAIIKTLERVSHHTGQRPSVVFDNWLEVVKVTLEQLPEQFKAVAATGSLAPDPPEVAEVFQKVEQRQRGYGGGYIDPFKVWTDGFAKAFHLLLESASPGLWNNAGFYTHTVCGPDILGYVYEKWSNTSPQWLAQYFTPWPVAEGLMARMTIQNGEREVLDRLKEALTHPDNPLGFAVLLAGTLIPENDSAAHRDWFFNRIIPAAVSSGLFEPIRINDPAAGSGRLLLAAAAQYPSWAVHHGLVVVSGQDLDYTCWLMNSINVLLYGLNGYSLKLELAVAEGLAARQKPDAPATAYAANAERNGRNGRYPPDSHPGPSFREMFYAAEQAIMPDPARTTTEEETPQLVAI